MHLESFLIPVTGKKALTTSYQQLTGSPEFLVFLMIVKKIISKLDFFLGKIKQKVSHPSCKLMLVFIHLA